MDGARFGYSEAMAQSPQTRDELLAALRALKPWLEEQGVTDLRLFGSFARDEATAESDVDLLCRAESVKGWDIFGVEHDLGERLGRRVDLCEEGCLRPFAQKSAERDLILV